MPGPERQRGGGRGAQVGVRGAAARRRRCSRHVACSAAGDHVDERRLLAEVTSQRIALASGAIAVTLRSASAAAAALAQLQRGAPDRRLGHDHAVAQDRQAGRRSRPSRRRRRRSRSRGPRARPSWRLNVSSAGAVPRRARWRTVPPARPSGRLRGCSSPISSGGAWPATPWRSRPSRQRGGDRVGAGSRRHLVAVARPVDRVVDPAGHRGRAVAGGRGCGRVRVAGVVRLRPRRGRAGRRGGRADCWTVNGSRHLALPRPESGASEGVYDIRRACANMCSP